MHHENEGTDLGLPHSADPIDEPNGNVNTDRRGFFAKVGGLTAATLFAPIGGLSALSMANEAEAEEIGPSNPQERRGKAYSLRLKAAREELQQPLPDHPTNGDEELYPTRIGNFSKTLPHNRYGEVAPVAYKAFVKALASGKSADFEAIPLGGTVKLTNPQAAYAYTLEGPDSHHLGIPEAPAFASAHTAAEMAEVYWQALTRDVPFADYESDPLIDAAADDLSNFSDYRGPKHADEVTPATLFRGGTPGDLAGPFLSQFLCMNIPYGLMTVPQTYQVPTAGRDFMTSVKDWLAIQNGKAPRNTIWTAPPRYISTGRDLAEWVHLDFPGQAFMNAALILLGFGPNALDAANPYRTSATQGGFVTFGAAHVLDLMARVARQALMAAWYQKWLVHRRVRPEAFAGRVHFHMTHDKTYPIHPDLLASDALSKLFRLNGTYLLPMAYPEGCPTHPSYPAGHATIAGACATVLKAFFKESFEIPDPVQATWDGSDLEPYSGTLTVGGELNKLAANVALARDTAGVHYRSDGVEGIRLGEQVAIGMLSDYRETYNEPFAGFSLTRFDGTTVVVGA